MKGHLKSGHGKGKCRPNPWCDHGDNNKEHGGRYEWETQRWNGSKWVDVVSVNKVVAATPQNIIISHNESDNEPEHWKPKAPKYLWNLYTAWQQGNSVFPTRLGMTSEQVGDIMQNYKKYQQYY